MLEWSDMDPTLFNRDRLLSEGRCACLRCNSIIEAGVIKRWLDQKQTGVCPKCQYDALVPESLPLPERERIRRERQWADIE